LSQHYHIRRATAADSTLLAGIGAETFHDTFAADNAPANMAAYIAASFAPDKQAAELADPATRFLIAEHDGTVVAYACLRFASAPPAVTGRKPMEIVRIYVRKPWIGRGAGAQLMHVCLDEGRSEGCDTVWLGVWDRNTRAIAFYRKAGFAEVGAQAFQLGEERQRDLLMTRPIGR
jgi:GNAT superfamily N-acetyltransferase